MTLLKSIYWVCTSNFRFLTCFVSYRILKLKLLACGEHKYFLKLRGCPRGHKVWESPAHSITIVPACWVVSMCYRCESFRLTLSHRNKFLNENKHAWCSQSPSYAGSPYTVATQIYGKAKQLYFFYWDTFVIYNYTVISTAYTWFICQL